MTASLGKRRYNSNNNNRRKKYGINGINSNEGSFSRNINTNSETALLAITAKFITIHTTAASIAY
jgi:hypothetical protein